MRPLGDEGSRRICVKCALVGDGSRRESPRRALAAVRLRMFVGGSALRGAFVANAPPTSSLWVAPRRGAPTIPLAWARLTKTLLLCHFWAFFARVLPRFGAVWCDFLTLRDDFRSGGVLQRKSIYICGGADESRPHVMYIDNV